MRCWKAAGGGLCLRHMEKLIDETSAWLWYRHGVTRIPLHRRRLALVPGNAFARPTGSMCWALRGRRPCPICPIPRGRGPEARRIRASSSKRPARLTLYRSAGYEVRRDIDSPRSRRRRAGGAAGFEHAILQASRRAPRASILCPTGRDGAGAVAPSRPRPRMGVSFQYHATSTRCSNAPGTSVRSALRPEVTRAGGVASAAATLARPTVRHRTVEKSPTSRKTRALPLPGSEGVPLRGGRTPPSVCAHAKQASHN